MQLRALKRKCGLICARRYFGGLPLAFVDEEVDGGGCGGEDEQDGVLDVEQIVWNALGFGWQDIVGTGEVLVDIDVETRAEGHEHDQHEEGEQEEPDLAAMEHAGEEQVVEDCPADQHGENGSGSVAYGFGPSEGTDEEQGHDEIDEQPDDGLVVLPKERQYAVAGSGLFGLHSMGFDGCKDSFSG